MVVFADIGNHPQRVEFSDGHDTRVDYLVLLGSAGQGFSDDLWPVNELIHLLNEECELLPTVNSPLRLS